MRFLGFDLHQNAYVGFSWIYPQKLIMEEGARIDHFNVGINLDVIHMHKQSSLGRGNWITGFPTKTESLHFKHQQDRRAELIVGESSAITKYHHLDCTNLIEIGAFTTVAGYRSQFLTHSIDVVNNRQHSVPIHIGAYSFIGTNVVVLGGAVLPSRSVLGAKSLLNKAHQDEWTLYGGVPAKPIQIIPQTAMYFSRKDGFVH